MSSELSASHTLYICLILQFRDLAPAIKKAEGFRDKMAQFPPLTSGKHRETKSFAAIMDETMGFE